MQVTSLKKTAEDLTTSNRPMEETHDIYSGIEKLSNAWDGICALSNEKSENLNHALERAKELDEVVNTLLEWLRKTEMKLQFSGPLPENTELLQKAIKEHNELMNELAARENEKEFAVELTQKFLEKSHPSSVSVLKQMEKVIQTRWNEVAGWGECRSESLKVKS